MTLHSQYFVVTDALIFTGDEFIENGFVTVKDGKVVAVGSGPYKDSPREGMEVVPKPGHTLIPGLIDSHVHGLEGNIECLEQSLRFGVTTVCDLHNDPYSIKKLRALADDSTKKDIYSNYKCAGLGASIEGGWPAPILRHEFKDQPEKAKMVINSLPRLKTTADAKAFVEDQISQNGASFIKLMHELGDSINMTLPRPPLDVQKSVVATAHDNGLIAVGHAFSHAGAMDLLNSGVDGLTHIFFDEAPSDEWLDIMRANNAHCTPTLALCASQTGEGDAIQVPFTQDRLAQRMLFDKRPQQNVGLGAHNPRGSFSHAIQNTKSAYQAGMPIVVGSDAAGKHLGSAYGLGVHIEMYLLSHKIGMEPIEILKSATSLTADRLRFEDCGRIREGMKADLVLLEGEVRHCLADQSSLCLPVEAVWRDGVKAAVFSEDR